MKRAAANEFYFTDEDFGIIADALHLETGIHLLPSKATLVYLRLAKRLRALGLETFRDYCALLAGSNSEELPHMCAALTTNVTKFFREKHHFAHLREHVLPELLKNARRGKKIRIWSAGCSSGEEPYSIALTILSMMPDARSFDIRILATDINRHVLGIGTAGRYPVEQMAMLDRSMCDSWMERISTDGTQHYQLDDAVVGLVSFLPLNLMADWPMQGPFQVIFCRNVVIYFDEETQGRIWRRLVPMLDVQGVLYVGHSERISNLAELGLSLEENTTYRRPVRMSA